MALDEPPALPSAGIWRRSASMLYESLLVVAIAFFAGLLFYGAASGQLSGLLRHMFQIYLVLVLGLYFVWCWHHGGQTLPMKTWGLQLVCADGGPVSIPRGTLRYLLACLSMLCAGIGYFWALIDRDGQFLHDRLAGTRIIRTGH